MLTGTTILGLKCEGYCVLAADSQATMSSLATVCKLDTDKTIRVENHQIHMGCAGSYRCQRDLEYSLERYPCQPPNTLTEAAVFVVNHINLHHAKNWYNSNLACRILAVGFVGNAPAMCLISRKSCLDKNYTWDEIQKNVISIGNGSEKVESLFRFFRPDLPNMTEKRIEDFAYRIIRVATLRSWESGGHIRIKFAHPDYSSGTVIQQSSNPRSCRSRYDTRTDWSDDANAVGVGQPRTIGPGPKDLLLLLLSKGARVAPNVNSKFGTLLHCACYHKRKELVKILLENGADVRSSSASVLDIYSMHSI